MWSYDEEELARICKKLQIPYSTTDIDVIFNLITNMVHEMNTLVI